jgi:hypothetical protein
MTKPPLALSISGVLSPPGMKKPVRDKGEVRWEKE